MSTHILVKSQFEGTHYYRDAPEEVAFLRHPHRHVFHVEAQIEVFHSDRELEFIMVKRALEKHLACYTSSHAGSYSCEMVAESVQSWAKETYPSLHANETLRPRRVEVKVFEDNENGAYIKED